MDQGKVTAVRFSTSYPSSDERDTPVRIVLPFKDQKSANAFRHQLSDLTAER